MSDDPKPCPGCGRERRSCWHMPCLYLETVMRRGKRATESWIRAGLPKELRAGVQVVRNPDFSP